MTAPSFDSASASPKAAPLPSLYIWREGHVWGPYDAATLRGGLDRGALARDTPLRLSPTGPWYRLGDVLPHLVTPQAPPVTVAFEAPTGTATQPPYPTAPPPTTTPTSTVEETASLDVAPDQASAWRRFAPALATVVLIVAGTALTLAAARMPRTREIPPLPALRASTLYAGLPVWLRGNTAPALDLAMDSAGVASAAAPVSETNPADAPAEDAWDESVAGRVTGHFYGVYWRRCYYARRPGSNEADCKGSIDLYLNRDTKPGTFAGHAILRPAMGRMTSLAYDVSATFDGVSLSVDFHLRPITDPYALQFVGGTDDLRRFRAEITSDFPAFTGEVDLREGESGRETTHRMRFERQ